LAEYYIEEIKLVKLDNIVGTASYDARVLSKYACAVGPSLYADVTAKMKGNGTFGCEVEGECVAKLVNGRGECLFRGGVIAVEVVSVNDEPVGVDVTVSPSGCKVSVEMSGYPVKRENGEFYGGSEMVSGRNKLVSEVHVVLKTKEEIKSIEN